MCAGKDTLWLFLVEKGYFEPIQFAFANKVKDVMGELFGVPVEKTKFESTRVIKKDDYARRVMQQLGANMRKIESKVWINYLLNKIKNNYDYLGKNYAITDVRHLNEADAIMEAGGRLIFLYASDELRRKRVEERDQINVTDKMWQDWSSHPSEYEVDEIYNKYHDHPNFLFVEQKSNDFQKNYQKIITALKSKNWF
jgi:hypothetical protein